MGKESYFQGALSNFIFEFSCGGAIRHLADQGYTARQIKDRLSVPVSYGRVREAVTAYYLEEGILLRREPVQGGQQPKYVYVQDHGAYGKTSFRRVPVEDDRPDAGGVWSQHSVTSQELLRRLREYGSRMDQGKAYVSCDYGRTGMDFEGFGFLNERQQEYLMGICWDRQRMYHLLDGRMMEIILQLCGRDCFCGRVYFEATKEALVLEPAKA